jgi:26S proteasome regulatory subunit N1
MALLSEYVENKSVPLRTSAIIGLGLAYAGSHREDLQALLLPLVSDETLSMEVASLAALALGFVFVGSGNGDVSLSIVQTLMEREDRQLDEKWARYMVLGLALVYLGLQDQSDATIEIIRTIEHPISRTALILLDICSFAATGNVLKVQEMLHYLDEKVEAKDEKSGTEGNAGEENREGGAAEEKKEESGEEAEKKPKDDTFQAFATIGVALLAMGEDIGAEMSLRQFNHLVSIASFPWQPTFLFCFSYHESLRFFLSLLSRCTMANP